MWLFFGRRRNGEEADSRESDREGSEEIKGKQFSSGGSFSLL